MASASEKKKEVNIFMRMHPFQRFTISLIVAALVFVLLLNTRLDLLLKIMITWEAFALSYIITSWIVFFASTPLHMRKHCSQEDGSRLYVFLLILFTSFASLFAIFLLMLSKGAKDTPHILYVPVAISGMLFSWLMVHTLFGFHYARLYYGNDKDDPATHAGGLDFPKDSKPDYLDFAYFSFVIGMTFQVSDTNVTSKIIRRLVLLHGLLSFALNTFVVALTINLIAELLK